MVATRDAELAKMAAVAVPELEKHLSKFKPSNFGLRRGRLQLNIREPGGRGVIGRWHLVVDTKKDEFAVREGAAPKRPTLLLTTSVRTLVGIGRGQVNPVTAMLRGRLRLKGNLLTGSRLEAAFRAAGGYTFAREFVDKHRELFGHVKGEEQGAEADYDSQMRSKL